MDIAVNKTFAVFRTPFSDTEDLVQAFSGIRNGGVNDQDPVDFLYAGLVRKTCPDIWHADRLLALSTDEAPPQVIMGADAGGNHAPECAVAVRVRGCALSAEDIGTLWRDDGGLGWTCLRPLPDGRWLFASDNLGPSDTEYAFAEKISGVLRRDDGAAVLPAEQRPRYPMTSCVRHLLRSVTALKDGRWIGAEGGIEGCGPARIREIYEIVNPVSAIRTLRNERPAGGYSAERCLALGDAMFRAEIVHNVSPDGTVTADFDYRTLQNVPWQGFLGLMYQEKCRPENGSVRRYIPGLRPFRDRGRRYDFSVPRDIALPFPASFAAGPDTWEDPDYPPDRQIEMILSGRAGGCVAFAAGILPEGDGRPEIRRRHAADALCPAPSRKSYITFWGASDPKKCAGRFTRARGAVFRRYYPSERDFSLCLIPRRDGGWLYADWMGKNGIIKERSFTLPGGLKPVLHRLRGDVSWSVKNGVLNMRGSRGFAVWALRPGGAADEERNG